MSLEALRSSTNNQALNPNVVKNAQYIADKSGRYAQVIIRKLDNVVKAQAANSISVSKKK